MPTIFDVARAAKVSIASVSLVLRDPETRRVGAKKRLNILRIAKQTGYPPNLLARGLGNHGTGIVGLAIPVRDPKISFNPTIADMLAGIQSCLLEQDYNLMFYSHKSEKGKITHSQIIRSKCTDGLIFINTRNCTESDMKGTIRELKSAHIPFVMINSAQEQTGINYVGVDDLALAAMAARYLVERGHRTIGMIAGSKTSPTSAILIRSFRATLESLGVPFRERWLGYSEFERQPTHDLIRDWLSAKNRPTALFCNTDQIVPFAYEALQAAGLAIPKDIAVLGRGDVPFAPYLNPPLTTLSVPIFDVGRQAAQLLIGSLKDRDRAPQRILLATKLVERGSV